MRHLTTNIMYCHKADAITTYLNKKLPPYWQIKLLPSLHKSCAQQLFYFKLLKLPVILPKFYQLEEIQLYQSSLQNLLLKVFAKKKLVKFVVRHLKISYK